MLIVIFQEGIPVVALKHGEGFEGSIETKLDDAELIQVLASAVRSVTGHLHPDREAVRIHLERPS
jgi:hypothetical protein